MIDLAKGCRPGLEVEVLIAVKETTECPDLARRRQAVRVGLRQIGLGSCRFSREKARSLSMEAVGSMLEGWTEDCRVEGVGEEVRVSAL